MSQERTVAPCLPTFRTCRPRDLPRHRSNPPQRRLNLPRHRSNPPQRRLNLPRHRSNPPQRRLNLPCHRSNPPQRRLNLPRHRSNPPQRRLNLPCHRSNPPQRRLNLLRQPTDIILKKIPCYDGLSLVHKPILNEWIHSREGPFFLKKGKKRFKKSLHYWGVFAKKKIGCPNLILISIFILITEGWSGHRKG